jgi:hypothetical protein
MNWGVSVAFNDWGTTVSCYLPVCHSKAGAHVTTNSWGYVNDAESTSESPVCSLLDDIVWNNQFALHVFAAGLCFNKLVHNSPALCKPPSDALQSMGLPCMLQLRTGNKGSDISSAGSNSTVSAPGKRCVCSSSMFVAPPIPSLMHLLCVSSYFNCCAHCPPPPQPSART